MKQRKSLHAYPTASAQEWPKNEVLGTKAVTATRKKRGVVQVGMRYVLMLQEFSKSSAQLSLMGTRT